MSENTKIIEISSKEESNIEKVVDSPKKKNKKRFNLNDLTKKQRIIIIVSASILFVLLMVLVYFLFIKEEEVKEVEEEIIIEKENYKYENGILSFIDEDKNEIGTYECQNKNEKLCFVATYSNEDDFDIPKYLYEDETNVKFTSDIYNKKYVFIYDNEKEDEENIILYNIESKEIIDNFKLIKEYKDNIVILKDKDDNYGLYDVVNKKENIEFKYDYLGYIQNQNNLVFKNNKKFGIINEKGNELALLSNDIKSYNDNLISVKTETGYYLYNYDKEKVIDDAYGYINIYGTYISLIKDNTLYLRDSNLNKLNEEGIKLSSDNYNTIYIYSKNGEKKETKSAFTLTENSYTLNVNYEGNTILINTNEAKINNSFDYVNYLDGKIYVYSDEKKENLIGSYTCSNKNNVTSENDEYNNCFIVKDSKLLNRNFENTVGYLPIYNDRFIFVKDNPNVVINNNVNIYDLVLNKNLATYKEVDTGYSGDENIHKAESSNTLILAKNTNDLYGIIKLDKTNISKIISFENTEIKYLGNYFLVKKDNKYNLYKEDGTKITNNSFDNEIVDFYQNIVVVKANDRFHVYNLNGTVLSSNDKFVSFLDNYYWAIDENNNLKVFKYNVNQNIIKTDYRIDVSNYEEDVEISIGSYITVKLTGEGVTKTTLFDLEGNIINEG